MVGTLLILLIIFWAFGWVRFGAIDLTNIVLFRANGHPITLWNILTFFLVLWVIKILPSPFRQIATVILILWLLSLFGILAFAGLANILLFLIILALILYLLGFL